MTKLVAADIGGTHARFAIAEVADGRVIAVAPPVILRTAEHATLEAAWQAFREAAGQPLPRKAAIAVASPVGGEILKLTNNPWTLRPAAFRESLGLDEVTLINDFGAVAHAVDCLGPDDFRHLAGPRDPLPSEGVVTILGPGTGLGVAQLVRRGGRATVIATEAGHMDFAPVDPLEDSLLAFLRARHGRVSVERIVSGPGLANIYDGLALGDGEAMAAADDKTLWAEALAGAGGRAGAAFDRFCLSLGSVAGDLALAHGAGGVVIAGGLGLRLADHLPASGFHRRFIAKGRFEALMASIPIWSITHPEPGLYGAAAAFAAEHRRGPAPGS